MENDLLEIADDTARDYQEIPNKEVVLRLKIRIESRQWLMSRRDPRLWGDKQPLDVSANIMLLSPEERVQKALQLFDLMEKFIERERNPSQTSPSSTTRAMTVRCCRFGSETAAFDGEPARNDRDRVGDGSASRDATRKRRRKNKKSRID